MKTMLKRSLAVLLVLLMAISVVPITAMADDVVPATEATPLTLNVTEGLDQSWTVAPSSTTITLKAGQLTLASDSSSIALEKIISAVTVGGAAQTGTTPRYRYYLAGNYQATAVSISNTPGETTSVTFTPARHNGTDYIVDTEKNFTIEVKTELVYVDYNITAQVLLGSNPATQVVNGTFSSKTPDDWALQYVRDTGDYRLSATVAIDGQGPATGLAVSATPATIGTGTTVPVTTNVTFQGGLTYSGAYVLRNPSNTITLTQLPKTGITLGGVTVYDNSLAAGQQWTATGTLNRSATALTPSFAIPFINSTDDWTISSAAADNANASCVLGGSGKNQTITYYPALDGNTNQKITFTFAKTGETPITFELNLVLASSAVTPTYTLPTTGTSFNVAANSAVSYNVRNIATVINGFAGMSAAQQAEYTYSITSNSTGYGVITGATTGPVSSTTANTVTYTAVTAGGSDTATVRIFYNGGPQAVATYPLTFTVANVTQPTFATGSNYTVATVNVGSTSSSYSLRSLVSNWGSLSDAVKNNITYTITAYTSTYGTPYYNSNTMSNSYLNQPYSLNAATNPTISYRPTRASGTSYDSFTVTMTYEGTSRTYSLRYIANAAASSYTVRQFNNSYGSSSAFGVYLANRASSSKTFARGDFENSSIDFTSSTYSNYYVEITQAPIGGTLNYNVGDEVDVRSLSGLRYTRSAATDTGIDCFQFRLYNNSGRSQGTYTMWIVSDNDLLDDSGDGYTESQFNASYGGSTVFGTYLSDTGSYLTFSADSFKNSNYDLLADYDDHYVELYTEPVLGTVRTGSNASTALEEGDRIAIENLSGLRYYRDERGIDRFDFRIYTARTGGTSRGTFTMWIVNSNSLLDGTSDEGVSLIALDFTVSTFEEEEVDFARTDFTEALALNDRATLSRIYITELPEDGILYYNNDEVDEDDYISASNLGYLTYEPDGSSTDYTDSFTWYAVDSDGGESNEAKANIYVFADEDDYDYMVVSGDVSAYMDSNGEIEFAEEYFVPAFDQAGTRDTLDSIYIISLPTSGTLTYGTRTLTSSDVRGGYEIDVDDLDDLVYEGTSTRTASFDYMANYFDDEDATEGTVNILRPITGTTTASVGTWSSTSTTSPVYTISNASSGTLTLGSSFVTEALRNCRTGSNLTIIISPRTATNSLSLTIDASMFTLANAANIPYITLSEGTTGASVTVDVADFIAAAGANRSMNITLNKLTISSNAIVNSTATVARSIAIKAGTANVTLAGADSVKLTMPYTNSSTYNDNMVVMYNYSSNRVPLTSSEFTGRFVSAYVASSGQYLVAVNNVTFSDITDNWAWTRGYIPALAARGTIDGYPNGTYQPNGNVTRAEFIKLLIVSLGLEDSSATSSFSDLPSSHWAYRDISAALKLGIVDSASTFSPDTAITRQDMALYAYRAARAAGLTLSSSAALTTFTDESQITGERLTAVKAMQAAGIINGMAGTNAGAYMPLEGTKRADASKIIWFLNALLYGWDTTGKY